MISRKITLFLFTLLMVADLFSLAVAKSVTIGGKDFTEHLILTELANQLLTAHGFDVEVYKGVSTSIARQALENGQLDLYYEYTGTAYTVIYAQKDRRIMTNPIAVYNWVKQADRSKGLILLEPLLFNNTYALLLRKEQAERLNLKTISELAYYVQQNPNALQFAVQAEAWERPDGFKALMDFYGFQVGFSNLKKMDLGLVYLALHQGYVDVGFGTTTDGRIQALNLVPLIDDQHFSPIYNPVPVMHAKLLEQYPEIESILNTLVPYLTTQEIQRLNAEVDAKHRSIAEIVREWLREKKLIS